MKILVWEMYVEKINIFKQVSYVQNKMIRKPGVDAVSILTM